MAQEQTSIRTAEGDCPAWVVTPEGAGPWPAVIVYMDAFGIRPALLSMAQQLADEGYVALVPDLFYRHGPYETMVPAEIFKGDFMSVIGPFLATTDNVRAAEDTKAFIAYLETRTDVTGRIGAVGFCMGGGMALTAAGKFPEHVGAAASFHGGYLATDYPTSPHLLAPEIKAEVYVAGAENDDSYPPAMAERLANALDDAKVRNHTEIYPGAIHGWMMPDVPIYNEAAASRGWGELLALFDRNLR